MAVIFLSACKKKDDPNTGDPSNAVLKTVSQTPSGITITYSYDSERRLTQLQNSDGSGKNITYSGDTVFEALKNSFGVVYAVNTLFLNTDGIAIASYLSDTTGATLSYSEYEYDSTFIVEERIYSFSGVQIGRKTWGILYDNIYYFNFYDSLTSQNNYTLSYAYSYDHVNSVGNRNTGVKYYGNSSHNIETSMTKISSVTGNVRYVFKYTFDDSGRMSSKSAYNHLNELVYTNTYSYQ